MKRLHLSPKVLFISLIAITILCSPSFDILFYKFQFAAFPESWHSLAMQLRAIPPITIGIWLFVAGIAPIVTVFTLLGWPLKSSRKIRCACVAVCLIAWSTLFLGTDHADARQNGLIHITQSGKPIIAAIEKYHANNGKYPAQLEALVPTYLSEIPYTGLVGYPKFEYRLPNTKLSEEYKDDSSKKYELFVSMGYPSPLEEHSDYFIYWPEKQYPASVYDGFALYEIGDWAYAEYIS